ncbi:MAG: DUF2344 domain-containing protein [Lachnospiraceae bacterium]|nr:DUF2344 domain-containing protein [Lachnospiraceae bacterium]
MRVRVRFSKTGSSRFLGHLDIMRYFQKAFRRAGLPLAFSEGYHPHPLLSFAQPLSLSFTSNGEYFDMELTEPMEAEVILERLNAVMCEDIAVNRVTILPDYKPNAKKITGMALITGAAYAISLSEMTESIRVALTDFYAEKSYLIEKSTKTGTRECDLRAGVHAIALYDNGMLTVIGNDKSFRYSEEEMLASMEGANLTDEKAVIVFLDAGSEQNIPADLFYKGVMNYAGITEIPARTVHRMDLFGDISERKVPLWMIES